MKILYYKENIIIFKNRNENLIFDFYQVSTGLYSTFSKVLNSASFSTLSCSNRHAFNIQLQNRTYGQKRGSL